MSPVLTRRLYEVLLQPVLGSRFQPTGFPDIGPAQFERPGKDGTLEAMLLVESAQSMANRLEAVGWDEGSQSPSSVLDGLSWVRVVAADKADKADKDRYLTSSRTEAHRLASAFIRTATLDKKKMTEVIRDRIGMRVDTPLPRQQLTKAVMAMDPLCLLHGVFFTAKGAKEFWPGQPKIARAVTGFIEAAGVQSAVSGGVKRDMVRHGIEAGEAGSEEGYGSIPFHRTEFSARSITAFFSVDLEQLRSYGLGEAATELLDVIARWEIASLLAGGMRLRTACDLEPKESADVADRRSGERLEDPEELAARIPELVGRCGDLLGDGGPIEVKWKKA